MNKLRVLILIVACAGVIVSGVMICKSRAEYGKAKQEYEMLNKFVNDVPESKDEVAEDIDDTEVTDDSIVRNYNRKDFPDFKVDFDGLKAANHDYLGWLYVPGAEISYPVVQGSDNDYYLHHTFEKESNFAGCLFIDCEDSKDFSNYNTFIYGHAMKNGTMFGNLKKFRKDKSIIDADPYIYMYFSDGIYRYKIYSFYIDKPDSEMYNSCDNLKQYRQYLRLALDKSLFNLESEVSEESNSLTLVTCSGAGSNKKRFFVHAMLVDRYLTQ